MLLADSSLGLARPDNLPAAHGPSILPAPLRVDSPDPAGLPERALDSVNGQDSAARAQVVLVDPVPVGRAVRLLLERLRVQAGRHRDAAVGDRSSIRRPRKAR